MAEWSNLNTLMFVACIAAFFLAATDVSAQMAPAPAPSMDTGAGINTIYVLEQDEVFLISC
ncbi:conserved hypothetical protein [Ricinus communis]|uniref:Uncharacterized protein n=1 Tax=Ricinus communis TaxID=3988 RepID=B9SL70_RICCO|nr:conserved hypothetical protein [Ricinus communis]